MCPRAVVLLLLVHLLLFLSLSPLVLFGGQSVERRAVGWREGLPSGLDFLSLRRVWHWFPLFLSTSEASFLFLLPYCPVSWCLFSAVFKSGVVFACRSPLFTSASTPIPGQRGL